MSKKNSSGGSLGAALQSTFTVLAIVVAFVTGYIVYKFIFGNPVNFEGNNPEGAPLPGNLLGVIYKGGSIVPFLIALNLLVVIFSFERGITLARAKGKGKINVCL